MHRDKKYYPNPEKFIPERFSPRNRSGKTFAEMPYMPFGDGPRICIGMRLAQLQVKIALILMLERYNFEIGSTEILDELPISPKTAILTPKTGLQLKVSKRIDI